jgi:peroxiredoxin
MKSPLITAALWFTLALTGCGAGVDIDAIAAASTAKVGEPAPPITLIDSTGQTRSLSDYAGKTVVLEWTNHGCPFVKKHYGAGNMQAQQRDATAADVVWLTVNSSAPGKQGHVDGAGAEAVRTDAKAAQTAYLLDPDGTTGRTYGAMTTPHMYVIDPAGVLRYAGAIYSIPSADKGDIAKATQYVPQALNELAAGQPISVALTRPYGCAVKY